jgi:acyl carrier protein
MKNTLNEKDAAAVDEILMQELTVSRDQLMDNARIEEDLGADSLTVAEIVIALESRFDLVIPDQLAGEIKTVGNLREAIGELLKAPNRR